MLPGIEGHLLSSAFIDEQLSAIGESAADSAQARRTLVAWRAACAVLGPASTPRTMLQSAAPLFATLGFEAAERVEPAEPAIAATLRSSERAVALLVSPWGDARDSLWRLAVTQATRRSASWCLIFNGLHLRIVDASRLYARRHLEIDLDLAIDNPRPFAALLHIFGAPALAAGPDDPRSLHALVAGSDRHAAGVCRSLRDGVLAASAEILRALIASKIKVRLPPSPPRGLGGSPTVVAQDSFEQALTIVYRMLFLLFAEARALVPLWHPIYRESYSLEGLRDAAEQSPPVPGLWDALRAIARLAHAGCRAGDLQVTPFNGRLFAPANAARRAQRPRRRRRAAGDRRALDASGSGSGRTGAYRVPRPRRRAAWCGL